MQELSAILQMNTEICNVKKVWNQNKDHVTHMVPHSGLSMCLFLCTTLVQQCVELG